MKNFQVYYAPLESQNVSSGGETWWLKASRQSRVLNEITTREIYVGGGKYVNEVVNSKEFLFIGKRKRGITQLFESLIIKDASKIT